MFFSGALLSSIAAVLMMTNSSQKPLNESAFVDAVFGTAAWKVHTLDVHTFTLILLLGLFFSFLRWEHTRWAHNEEEKKKKESIDRSRHRQKNKQMLQSESVVASPESRCLVYLSTHVIFSVALPVNGSRNYALSSFWKPCMCIEASFTCFREISTKAANANE